MTVSVERDDVTELATFELLLRPSEVLGTEVGGHVHTYEGARERVREHVSEGAHVSVRERV